MSKRKGRQRDTGLADYGPEEILARSRDKTIPAAERRRFQREAKARGLRNKAKRSK